MKTQSMYSFMADITSEIHGGNDKVRVGVLSRNCYDNDISLNEFDNEFDLINNLKNAEYKSLDHQVHRLRKNSFTLENGGRQNARKIAVLFSTTFSWSSGERFSNR